MHKGVVSSVAATLLLGGCSAVPANTDQDGAAAAGDEATTVETCGHTETFDSPPERVIVNTRGLVEVLAALGVADRVQQYSTLGHSHYEPLDKYQDTISEVTKGSDGTFSKEAVVAQDPDLFYSDMNYGGDMVDNYEPLDIPVLFATRWCPQHAPTTQGAPDLIRAQYQDVAELGRIFGVTDTATELIDGLKQQMTDAAELADEHTSLDVASIAMYDGVDGRMTVNRSGMIDQLIELTGGNNIYSADSTEAGDTSDEIGVETLISDDPDVIIVRETGQGDYDTVRDYFRNDERFADIDAVKNDRFTYIHHSEALAGIQFPKAALRLADAFDSYSE